MIGHTSAGIHLTAWQRLIVVISATAVVALGVMLRSVRLGGPLLTADEAFTWRLVTGEWGDQLLRVARDVHPPLYFMLCKCWVVLSGNSHVGLRLFSSLLGGAALPLVYLTVMEALKDSKAPLMARRWGAVLSVLVASVHLAHIEASRTARMYSLAILLTALSSWLLLRAMRTERYVLYGAYGGSMALLCYTHYFGLLIFAAHVLYGTLAQVTRLPKPMEGSTATMCRPRWQLLGGFASGAVVFAALYSAWIPALWWQFRDVRTSYWVPEITVASTLSAFQEWSVGVGQSGVVGYPSWLLLAVVLAAATAAFWKRSCAFPFFALLAFVPWILVMVIDWLLHRPLLQPRYLWPAHIGLLGLVGASCTELAALAQRYVFSALFLVPLVLEAIAVMPRIPAGPSILERVVQHVNSRAHPGDLVLVDHPGGVNCLRYYADRLSADLRFQWLATGHTVRGHTVHVASLATDEVATWRRGPPDSIARYWEVEDDLPFRSPVPDGWSMQEEHMFSYGQQGRMRYGVRLLVREAVGNERGIAGAHTGARNGDIE